MMPGRVCSNVALCDRCVSPDGLDRGQCSVLVGAIVWLAVSAERMFDVVIVAEPEGGYSVFVPELPSVATQGETIKEARTNAQEAIEGYLEVMHEDGLPIPSVHRDRVAVHAA
jgi:predicted RNase H-like HicB family nuclease